VKEKLFVLLLFITACAKPQIQEPTKITPPNVEVEQITKHNILKKSEEISNSRKLLKLARITNEIIWHDFSFKSFFKAKVQERFIIINFYSESCDFCNLMDSSVYNNPDIIKKINSRFFTIKVDGEKEVEIIRNFGDPIYPTTVFMTPTGVVLAVIQGYIPTNKYNLIIDTIIKAADEP